MKTKQNNKIFFHIPKRAILKSDKLKFAVKHQEGLVNVFLFKNRCTHDGLFFG